jgi:hypothetical protein
MRFYCPNCNIDLGYRDVTACENCGAVFGEGADWQPISEQRGPVRHFDGTADLLAPPYYYVVLTVVYRLILWTGHFFLIGYPALFLLYSVYLHDQGEGVSGIPLILAVILPPPIYAAAALMYGLRALTPHARAAAKRKKDRKAREGAAQRGPDLPANPGP